MMESLEQQGAGRDEQGRERHLADHQNLPAWCGVLASGGVALGLVAGLAGDQDRVDNQTVPYASWVAAAALDAKGVANDQRGFLLTGDPSFIDEADRRIASARTAFNAAAATAADADQAAAVSAAAAGFERWVVTVRAEFVSYQAGDHGGAVASSLGDDRTMRKAYEQALTRAQQLGDQAVARARQSATRSSAATVTVLTVVLVVAVVVGIAIVIWLMRTIALPVFRLITLLTPELG